MKKKDIISLDKDQLYIFAKQHRRILRLKDQVDYIITDSPLLLSIVYSTLNLKLNMFDLDLFIPLVTDISNRYNNLNILLKRNEEFRYQQEGRYQNEEEAKIVDEFLKKTISKYCKQIVDVISNEYTSKRLMNFIEDEINELG